MKMVLSRRIIQFIISPKEIKSHRAHVFVRWNILRHAKSGTLVVA
jgi:hypothetical protein